MSEWTGHEEWMQDAEAIAAQNRDDERAYGGTAAARRNVDCECGHDSGHHEGDEYGFCLVCDCNHYRPVIAAVSDGGWCSAVEAKQQQGEQK